jgi:thiol-disulfide isomerase/thioredoxin
LRPRPVSTVLWSGILLTLVLGFATGLSASPAGAGTKAPVAAPKFTLPTRAHTIVALDSLRAKVVLVDFWASWCGPCRKSFPWMASLQERYGSKGLAIVAINLDKKREDAEKFLAQFPAPFTVAFDPDGRTAEAYGVSGMPTTYVVGRDGTVLDSHLGFDPKKTGELEALIEKECAR